MTDNSPVEEAQARAREAHADPWAAVRAAMVIDTCSALQEWLDAHPASKHMPMTEINEALVLGVPLEILSRVLLSTTAPPTIQVQQIYSTQHFASTLLAAVNKMIEKLESHGITFLVDELRERHRAYMDEMLRQETPASIKEM